MDLSGAYDGQAAGPPRYRSRVHGALGRTAGGAKPGTVPFHVCWRGALEAWPAPTQRRDIRRGRTPALSPGISPRVWGHESGTYTLPALPRNDESPAICGAFSEAAEGTRTLDLLH